MDGTSDRVATRRLIYPRRSWRGEESAALEDGVDLVVAETAVVEGTCPCECNPTVVVVVVDVSVDTDVVVDTRGEANAEEERRR